MYGLFYFLVRFSLVKLVKAPAQIGQRSQGPVSLIHNLHFYIHNTAVIHFQLYIKHHQFILYSPPALYGIHDPDRFNHSHIHVKQGAEQPLQGSLISLQHRLKHKIIGQSVRQFSRKKPFPICAIFFCHIFLLFQGMAQVTESAARPSLPLSFFSSRNPGARRSLRCP